MCLSDRDRRVVGVGLADNQMACRLAEAVRGSDAACRVNGDPATGLPGLVSLSFAGLEMLMG